MRNAFFIATVLIVLALAITACVPHQQAYNAVPGTSLSWEQNVDRPGMDYNHFVSPSAIQCRKACMADPNCMAFTFVQPGIQDPNNGMCWLKNGVPAAVPNNVCISGVRN